MHRQKEHTVGLLNVIGAIIQSNGHLHRVEQIVHTKFSSLCRDAKK
jgi:hypothetical protein